MTTNTDIIADAIAEGIGPLVDRVRALERQVTEVQKGALVYRGIFSRGVDYPKGSVITADGAAWISVRATTGEKPGTAGADGWVMIAKGRL